MSRIVSEVPDSEVGYSQKSIILVDISDLSAYNNLSTIVFTWPYQFTEMSLEKPYDELVHYMRTICSVLSQEH